MATPYYCPETLQPCNSVGYLVKRCGILAMQVAERAFQSQPVTFTQCLILSHLRRHPSLSPTELSSHLGHDMGALTRIVDDLQEKQLVRRERPEKDRRAVQITITPAGRRMATMMESVVVSTANSLVDIYSKAETDALISLLQRLLTHMEKKTEQLVEESSAGPRRAAGRLRK